MTKREWKPGDLVMVTHYDKPLVALVRPRRNANLELEFSYTHGGYDMVDSLPVNEIRPLVVIDPEDRATARRFAEHAADGDAANWRVESWQRFLREFANPTPPRPEEPTGLGAVVEDISQVEFIHLGSGLWAYGTTDGPSKGFAYADIAAVKVLSEGVVQS